MNIHAPKKSEGSALGGKAIRTRSRPPEGVGASAYIITDGHGYWCGRRRDKSGKVDFWSSKKVDAERIHFYEAAQTIASRLPMPTRIVATRSR